jgi:hypothetical protein
MIPIVRPILMIKEIGDSGMDFCEYAAEGWRQMGLQPNPDAPLTHEYIANPLDEDSEFAACGDYSPIRDEHRRGFRKWIRFLQG